MTFLTAIIAVATIINIAVFWYESEDTSQKIGVLSGKAGEIVGAMNTALSNNRDAVQKAFQANHDAVEASERENGKAVRATLDAADNSNKIARLALEIQTRPWIEAPEKITSAIPDAFSSKHHFFDAAELTIPLHNFGQTPAIVMEPRLIFGNLGKPEIRFFEPGPNMPARRDLCANPESRFKIPVFQGTIKPKSVQAFVADSDSYLSDREGGRPPWNLFGCIVYYGSEGGGPYTTKVVYNVSYSDDLKTITGIYLVDMEIK
jgi:hypothetical protein